MPDIRLDGGDTAFHCDEDDTILRAALRAGLGFPYECNTGSCGNCRFELKEGEVEHLREDPPAWSERDLKRNRWLGCQARAQGDCTIKVRLRDEYVPVHRPLRTRATLTDVVEYTHDISEFGFDLETPAEFRPGQYALLNLPGVEGGRAYSMSNLDPAKPRFLIKRVPGGEATTQLFETLKPGDDITIDMPYGNAWLREDAPRDLLLIAGGSGLSPMISIARRAAESPALKDRKIHFLYGGRAPRDICGQELLEVLPDYGTRIHYEAACSVESEGWDGPTGFLHDVAVAQFGDTLKDHEVYFAGPPAMSQALQKTLFEAGVPMTQVHFDEFY